MNDRFATVLSASEFFPDNKPNNFRWRPQRPLEFDGDYLCALHDIVYPNSWTNVDNEWVDIDFLEEVGLPNVRFILSRGHFSNVSELLAYFSDSFKRVLQELQQFTRNRKKNLDARPQGQHWRIRYAEAKAKAEKEWEEAEKLSHEVFMKKPIERFIFQAIEKYGENQGKSSVKKSLIDEQPPIDDGEQLPIDEPPRKRRHADTTKEGDEMEQQEVVDADDIETTEYEDEGQEVVPADEIETTDPDEPSEQEIVPADEIETTEHKVEDEAKEEPLPHLADEVKTDSGRQAPIIVKEHEIKTVEHLPPAVVGQEIVHGEEIESTEHHEDGDDMKGQEVVTDAEIETSEPVVVTDAEMETSEPVVDTSGVLPPGIHYTDGQTKIVPEIIVPADETATVDPHEGGYYLADKDHHRERSRAAYFEDTIKKHEEPDALVPYKQGDRIVIGLPRIWEKNGTLVPPDYQNQVSNGYLDIRTIYAVQELISKSNLGFKKEEVGRLSANFNRTSKIKSLKLSPLLGEIMGYGSDQVIFNEQVGKYAPDPSAGLHQFVIYEKNGLLEHTLFGDKLTSVLRHVPVSGTYGQIVHENYDNPIWVPVRARYIDEMHFELRTMYGEPVPFQFGSITMTLVFKRALF